MVIYVNDVFFKKFHHLTAVYLRQCLQKYYNALTLTLVYLYYDVHFIHATDHSLTPRYPGIHSQNGYCMHWIFWIKLQFVLWIRQFKVCCILTRCFFSKLVWRFVKNMREHIENYEQKGVKSPNLECPELPFVIIWHCVLVINLQKHL